MKGWLYSLERLIKLWDHSSSPEGLSFTRLLRVPVVLVILEQDRSKSHRKLLSARTLQLTMLFRQAGHKENRRCDLFLHLLCTTRHSTLKLKSNKNYSKTKHAATGVMPGEQNKNTELNLNRTEEDLKVTLIANWSQQVLLIRKTLFLRGGVDCVFLYYACSCVY